MKTKITELLGIEYPIIQGGMAWVAEHKLAAAVSNAGGLGLIGAASAPPEVVRDEIRKCRALTEKPFGVNVMLLNPNADEVAKIIVEEGVKVVTTGAGSPSKYMDMWKKSRGQGDSGSSKRCYGKNDGARRCGCSRCGRNGKRWTHR